jgi:hypothetical protein
MSLVIHTRGIQGVLIMRTIQAVRDPHVTETARLCNNCMAVFVSLVIHIREIREVLDLRGTVQAARDPHDTEGVRCTYIGHVWDCTRGYSTRGSP